MITGSHAPPMHRKPKLQQVVDKIHSRIYKASIKASCSSKGYDITGLQ